MFDPAIVLLGFGIGILVGLTSIGMGFVGTPALVFLLNINPSVAIASELLHGSIIKVIGASKHLAQKTAEPQLALPFIIGGIPFAYLGSYLSNGLDDAFLKFILGIVLVVVSVLIILDALYVTKTNISNKPIIDNKKVIFSIITGAIAGFITGLTSIGTGIIIITSMLLILKLPPSIAVGTNLFVGMSIAGIASITHLSFGNTNLNLVLNLLTGSVPGIIIGSHYSAKAPVKLLRLAIGLLVLFAGSSLVKVAY